VSEVRRPPKTNPVVTSANQIDWETARKAALAIVKQCDDAAFAPPEALDIHQMRVGYVCVALDTIVDALRIRRGGE